MRAGVALAFALPLAAHAAPDAIVPSRDAPPYRVPRAETAIAIDGRIDEPAWDRALTLEMAYEVRPAENEPAPVRTFVFLTYDEHRMYVAFRALDPHPGKIRARLSARDDAWADDWLGVAFDTFNDNRRAYEFVVNPLGVQIDALNDDIGGKYDTSWDAIWDSAGALTGAGYEVEFAVPFDQMRIQPGGGAQVWGFDAFRSWPRDVRHHIGVFPRDRGANSYLAQTIKIEGMEGVRPGRNFEIDPTLTASRTDTVEPGTPLPDAELVEGDVDAEIGVSVRWGITPNASLNAALNPDFSQVEADAVQLDVNQQFALFYPEKRPFFLEGADYFNTPVDLLYTRQVADPAGALKVTGKSDRHTYGAFSARDEITNLLFPGPEGSGSGSYGFESLASVARYRYDFGERSTAGGMVTDRRGDGYAGTTASGDVVYRPSDRDTFGLNAAYSRTEYNDAILADTGGEPGPFDGHGLSAWYDHSTRDWWAGAGYDEFSDGFRADLGFVPRVGYRSGRVGAGRVWWPASGRFLNRIELGGDLDRTERTLDGSLLEKEVEGWLGVQGKGELVATLGGGGRTYVYEDIPFEQQFVSFSVSARPSRTVALRVGLQGGDWIDFVNVRPADRQVGTAGATLNLGRHVRADLSYARSTLDVEGGRLFTEVASELRLVYQIGLRAQIRAIGQWRNVERDLSLYDPDVAPGLDSDLGSLATQILGSYKINARTALYVGYSDLRVDTQDVDSTPLDRTLFIKIGYAWLL